MQENNDMKKITTKFHHMPRGIGYLAMRVFLTFPGRYCANIWPFCENGAEASTSPRAIANPPLSDLSLSSRRRSSIFFYPTSFDDAATQWEEILSLIVRLCVCTRPPSRPFSYSAYGAAFALGSSSQDRKLFRAIFCLAFRLGRLFYSVWFSRICILPVRVEFEFNSTHFSASFEPYVYVCMWAAHANLCCLIKL